MMSEIQGSLFITRRLELKVALQELQTVGEIRQVGEEFKRSNFTRLTGHGGALRCIDATLA